MTTSRWQALLTLLLLGAAACGETSGTVLERIPKGPGDPNLPPDSFPVVKVLIVRELSACAVGEPCGSYDPDSRNDRCFSITHDDGSSVSFRADRVEFVEPDDPRVDRPDEQCFRLTLSEQEIEEVKARFADLRLEVYRLSGNRVLPEIAAHELSSVRGGLERWNTERGSGLFLSASALADGLRFLSRDTDFLFSVTGSRDREAGLSPSMEHCAGTAVDATQPEVGTEYTWLAIDCNERDMVMRHWLIQSALAVRDVMGLDDYYDDGYPDRCDRSPDVDPQRWFPFPDDCDYDPDAPTCRERDCEGTEDEFVSHVLTAHWPREFVGNHCRNGVSDYDEDGVDSGGICERLGQ